MLLFPSLGGLGVAPCIAFEAVIDLTIFYRAIAGLGIAIFRKSIHRAMMLLKDSFNSCSRRQYLRLQPVTQLSFKTECRLRDLSS